MSEAILEAKAAGRTFKVHGQNLHALSDISLSCASGQSIGIVGESGCGKTTLNRLLLKLDNPTSGEIQFKGKDLAEMDRGGLKAFRRAVQPVFQNPYSSLNPRMRARQIIAEPLLASAEFSRTQAQARVIEVLQQVGLRPEDAEKFPSEFSGGQRQRIAIARALAPKPELLLLDEPVSSQDISIQAQILNLLKSLREEHGLAILFISHDLATVRFMCDEVVVMYLGRVVERGTAQQICTAPNHPYSKALLASALPADPHAKNVETPPMGELPSPLDPPSGCAYHTRCPFVMDRCSAERPKLQKTPTGMIACHLADEDSGQKS